MSNIILRYITSRWIRRIAGAAYVFLLVGGIISYALDGGPPAWAGFTAPLFLALAGLLTWLYLPKRQRPWILLAGIIGFVSEIIGVATGWPFGPYYYTNVLFPRIAGSPVVMIFAWMALIAYVAQMSNAAASRKWPWILGGALWMTAIDLVIDPLAAGPLNYWRWERSGMYFGIPSINFAGWYLVSALILFVIQKPLRSGRSNRSIRALGLSIIVFFTIIALAIGLYIPGLVGTGLVLLHVFIRRIL